MTFTQSIKNQKQYHFHNIFFHALSSQGNVLFQFLNLYQIKKLPNGERLLTLNIFPFKKLYLGAC
jgi:hypothetical protein